MFDGFVDLGFAVFGYCDGDTSTFWNYALTNQILTQVQLSKVEEAMEDYEEE